jgi:hypothetical protein
MLGMRLSMSRSAVLTLAARRELERWDPDAVQTAGGWPAALRRVQRGRPGVDRSLLIGHSQ